MLRYSHEKWIGIREQGYLRFLIFRGIPIYGLSMVIISTVGRDVFSAIFSGIPVDWDEVTKQLPQLCLLGTLLGNFFGTCDYSRRERLYYKEERTRRKRAKRAGEMQDLA